MLGYLRSLALTFAVEVPVYAAGLRALLEVPVSRGATAAVAVNVATHPLAFLVAVPALSGAIGATAALVVVEAAAWAAEAALLALWLRRLPAVLAALSLVANGLSLSAGLAWLR